MRTRLLAPLLLLPLAGAAPLASIDGLPIGALPRQSLPVSGCAAYLFTTGATRAFAAMATTQPAALKLSLEGKLVTLAQTEAGGSTARGLPASATFAGQGATASLSLRVVERGDLTGGSAVPDATLTLTRDGRDTVVVPLAGLATCR